MDTEKIGKAITYLRKRAGYTQKELADRLGVSDKAVSKWERGLGVPDVSLLGKVSILLDTDTDSLLLGDVIHHDRGWHGILILNENEYGIGPDTIVYDKPLIDYLLSYFLLVGVKNIKIVCSNHAESYIKEELCNGEFDFSLSFCRKVDDVTLDSAFMDCESFMVVFGRSFIYGVDMTRFFQKAMSEQEHLTVLTLPKGSKSPSSVIRFDANKKIVPENHRDKLVTQYNYCDIPVMFCPKKILSKLHDSATSRYDISWVFTNENVYIEALDRGFVEIRIDTWEDVEEAASFVKVVQHHCGMIIYCIEEVAWRRGLISTDKMRARAIGKENTTYGKYVLQLIE